ncbi:MAG: glutathione synthase [Gammaproteobacteria bacterium]|nr:glutathione synthase [Gammaproteobacteria bacterium]
MSRKLKRIGIVMDPIASITPKKDSSFAMLLEAQRRGVEIHYFEQRHLRLLAGLAHGRSTCLSVTDDLDDWYRFGEQQDVALGDLDAILMRKDPPFDMEYVYTTYILERASLAGALIVNDPAALRDMNEKVYTAWFPDCTPLTLVTRSMSDIKEFVAQHERVVVKPLDGMGGRSIFVVQKGDNNANVIIETLTDYGRRFALAQVFIPEIKQGDKRILLIDGEPVPYALARVPSADDYRGNIVAGAIATGQALSDADRRICAQVGPRLRDAGVVFAGIDVIGDYLTEVNVTSPTGLRELDREFDLNIAGLLFDAMERKLA